ncbi:MAG: glycoside hydrolase [Rhodopirellula sp.]|uniref:family 43 glycosylhydrolase n=3 Tax=Rhodopirellula TaxID=265488 RepID=UPI000C54284F|nr:glycoside hydrolase [Rhodopirellula sp.]|tara:strand:+ start:3848 stop:5326 length:1479 start_codon:yes stop_codon:yes gene_type:complete
MKSQTILAACLLLAFPFAVANSAPPADGNLHVILGGDHADPTIVRDGEDFYITHSSYRTYPGLTIWHSTNLTDWKPISNALHQDVGTVWAPDLIKHDGLFYLYFPSSGKNYVVTAEDPHGPWSDPIELDVPGIDPGHIATPEGDRYLYMHNGNVVPLSRDGLKVTGDPEQKHRGWQYPADWEVECFCLESPKLIFRDGYYYMTAAQGGTAGPATSHMVTSARSRSPLGPWENSPHNPVVHTWSRNETYWSKGHGTIIDDADGNWYVVYHGYKKGALPHGRHTLIEAIEWTDDGWFKLKRDPKQEPKIIEHLNGPVSNDSFESSELGLQWQLTGAHALKSYQVGDGRFRFENPDDRMRTLQVISPEKNYDVRIELGERDPDVELGLSIWYSEARFAGVAVQGDRVIMRLNDSRRPFRGVRGDKIRFLRATLSNQTANLYVSEDGENWTKCSRTFELSGFDHNVLGSFSYLRPAIYAEGTGNAEIRSFEYSPLD